MSVVANRYLDPAPGTFMTAGQGQRAECLRVAIDATSGRSVPIQTVWAIARWLYDNRGDA